jgi:hypothetical protein
VVDSAYARAMRNDEVELIGSCETGDDRNQRRLHVCAVRRYLVAVHQLENRVLSKFNKLKTAAIPIDPANGVRPDQTTDATEAKYRNACID